MTVTPEVTCGEAIDILQSLGYDQLPVVGDDNAILGVVTEGNMTSRLMSGRAKTDMPVTKALYPQFRKITVSTTLAELARIFDRDHFAVVVQTQRTYKPGKGTVDKSVIVGVVTRIDLLEYIAAVTASSAESPRVAAAATTAAAAAGGAATGGAGAAATTSA